MQMNLYHAPPGVDQNAWQTSLSGGPRVGDLWLLSWNSEALGLALVTGVAPSFILAWPVTFLTEPAFQPALHVDISPLGPIAVWPTRETGIGNHLLHRRFGSELLSQRLMARIAQAVDGDGELPLSFVESDLGRTERQEISGVMIDRWEWINAHTWPPVVIGMTPFSADALRSLGLLPSVLSERLDIPLPHASALFGERAAPTAEQVERMCAGLNLDPEDILTNELNEGTLHLVSPLIKDRILQIGQHLELDEAGARSRLAEQYALAARSDGNPESRIQRAIHTLLSNDDI